MALLLPACASVSFGWGNHGAGARSAPEPLNQALLFSSRACSEPGGIQDNSCAELGNLGSAAKHPPGCSAQT